MSAAVKRKIVWNGKCSTATKLMANGSKNCAIDTDILVKMLATVPFSLKISIQDGVILVSRNELAIPLSTASA